MQKAAIYVRDSLTIPGSIISKEDQEKACRDYCKARGCTVSATFSDTAGSRDEFTRMICRDHPGQQLSRLHRRLEAQPLFHVPRGDHRSARQAQTSWHPTGFHHREGDRRLAVSPEFIS